MEFSAHGSPVVLRAIVTAAIDARRAARGAGRVHAARVSERPDRSDAGGSGRRSDRRGDAAAGARGVRSTRGTLTRTIARDRCDALRSDRAARSVGRFSRGGLSLRRARRAGGRIDALIERTRRCWPMRRRGRLDSRRAADCDRRRAERREIEPVQRARRRVARDRDRRAGHDARSGHRGRRLDGLRVTLVDTAGLRETADRSRPKASRGRGRRIERRRSGAAWSRIDRGRDQAATRTLNAK